MKLSENCEVIEVQQNSPEWLEKRQMGIGGSEAAAVLGISKWSTPLRVWQKKIGEDKDGLNDNWAMRQGVAMEPEIRRDYAEKTGREVFLPKGIVINKKYPFMIANPDGITGDNRLFEAKTTKFPIGWGDVGTDQIPTEYMIQVQHYLIVLELEVADVSVSVGGAEPILYEVPADTELQQMIIEKESAFWEMVKNRIAPDPKTVEDVERLYKTSQPTSIQATNEILKALSTLKETSVNHKRLGDEVDELRQTVQVFMKENEVLDDFGTVLATWKSAKPTERFDANSFKGAHPDLYRQFLKTGEPSRRFLIK